MAGNNLYNEILMEMKKVLPTFAEYAFENGVRKYKALPSNLTVQDMYRVIPYLRETLPKFLAPEDVSLVINKIEGILLRHSKTNIQNKANDEGI